MMNRSFVDNHANKWNRVSKKAAQKAFDAGKRVMIIPCKLDPASPWACYAYASNKFGDAFDGIASFYASCNCSNEAGRRRRPQPWEAFGGIRSPGPGSRRRLPRRACHLVA